MRRTNKAARELKAIRLTVGIMLLATGCIGGRAIDTNGNAKNVTVVAQTCPSCPYLPAQTTSDPAYPGVWTYDTYKGEPSALPTNGETTTHFVVWDGNSTVYDIWHKPTGQIVLHEGIEKLASRVVDQVFPASPYPLDSDDDGLPDLVEADIGTASNNKDTDGDGIGDYAEVFGWDWVDYPTLGANPRRVDVFVEVDYVQYTDATGLHTWKLSDAVVAKLAALYGALSNVNVDGSTGVALHIVHDSILAKDTPCNDRPGWLTSSAPFNPRYAAGFRYAALCNGSGWSAGASGGTRRMYVRGPGFNSSATDDQTEVSQFAMYSRFAHELGHTLSLTHGGAEGHSNWKMNYPSLMNYSYSYDLNGSPHTLQGTQIQFSPGSWPRIDEGARGVKEVDWAAAGTSPTFLTSYDGRSFPVSGRNVDWGRDGGYNGIVSGILRFGTGVACVARDAITHECRPCNAGETMEQTCLPLMDSPISLFDVNDAALIVANVASGIPGVADSAADNGSDALVDRALPDSVTSVEDLRTFLQERDRTAPTEQESAAAREGRLQAKAREYALRYRIDPAGDRDCERN